MNGKGKQASGSVPRPRALWWGGLGLAVLGALTLLLPTLKRLKTERLPAPVPGANYADYAGSAACRDCHKTAYERWQSSHHALAERPFTLALDLPSFYPPRRIQHGTQTSEARFARQKFELTTTGLEGRRARLVLERVLGEHPLRQYLVPGVGGRWQMTELASDPRQRDWFDIFGDEDRQPGEWGHWTGRGMTWNTMCAGCHNTAVRKNYAAASDSYATTLAEMGVGCEACHGPMADHVAWQRPRPQPPPDKDPTLKRLSKDQMLAVCGGCHARRSELTGAFRPGDSFLDHYGLVMVDETDLYYADGQVREEDYEYASFLGSRLHGGGVRCGDCHEPHSSKTFTTDNLLCLRCHSTPLPPAPKIDPARHSFHKPGEAGDRCVDCHMPQTVYMQRHWRHDHGFTIPDPLLTKQQGVPNACTRCHQDRSVDWALEAAQKWYGDRLERPYRQRAQWVARARSGQRAAVEPLVRWLGAETNGYWRAVATGLLKPWVHEPTVTAALLAAVSDPEPLVRGVAARALEPLAGPGTSAVHAALERLLADPVRFVRVEAAWSLRSQVDTNSPAGHDLQTYLQHNADQPSGQLQKGVFALDRGDLAGSLSCFRTAVKWDRGSAPLRQALAVALSMSGQRDQAVLELQEACRLAPREAEYRFKLGLALNEVNRAKEAIAALEEAVRLEPRYPQAWYNLGLAYAGADQLEPALEAMIRAESADGASSQIAYGRATILARLGRRQEAMAAARRALELQPAHAEAAQLLGTLRE